MEYYIHHFVKDFTQATWSIYRQLLKKQISLRIVIAAYPPYYCMENHLLCLLFDLEHLPLERVVQRFESEGGKILYNSELYYSNKE